MKLVLKTDSANSVNTLYLQKSTFSLLKSNPNYSLDFYSSRNICLQVDCQNALKSHSIFFVPLTIGLESN